MQLDRFQAHAELHLSRRAALRGAAAAAAAAVLGGAGAAAAGDAGVPAGAGPGATGAGGAGGGHTGGLAGRALLDALAADPVRPRPGPRAGGPASRGREHAPVDGTGDQFFDPAAVEQGAWAPSRYGPRDQRGSFNEVTPAKTAQALRLLDTGRPVATYGLGELVVNGFPAFLISAPPRVYEQRLTALGYVPGPGYTGFTQVPAPLGPTRISANEERFTSTYHIATQVDGLPHIGVGDVFYNGFRGSDIARDYGTAALGNETMGPIVTRGIVLDVVDLVKRRNRPGTWFTAENGRPVLDDDYRITVADLQECFRRQSLGRLTPGDVVLIRTGWTHLVHEDPQRYLAREPGIFLTEARWLARSRPAIVGGDAWALEVLDPEVIRGAYFPVHQYLLVKHGIRVGESIVTDALLDDGIDEFVFMYSPQNVLGATAGCTPPVALAPQPARRRRRRR